jgi:small-conductance mechanosensitive channel
MVNLFGYTIQLPPPLERLEPGLATFLATALAWLAICLLAYLVVTYLLKAVARRLPGEVEDTLLYILRKPLIILIATLGVVNSLETLPLQPGAVETLDKLLRTVFMLVLLYVVWRLIKDVIVYYGRGWALKTESRIDDNIIPILNIFGPLTILVIGVLMILPMWGMDISSALVGAGVIGIIVGLALQDSLSNLFSGMSLVVEAAYRTGDLLQLADGSVCEVEEMGLRSTRMYSLDSHCTLYMPNKALANMTIINITKPTVEQRSQIEMALSGEYTMEEAESKLTAIAGSIPGVLMSNMEHKLRLVEDYLARMQARLASMEQQDPAYDELEREIACTQSALSKLECEKDFNQALVAFSTNLENLARGLNEREKHGFTSEEKREIKQEYLPPTQEAFLRLVEAAESWRREPDPYASPVEHASTLHTWALRNERLQARWEEVQAKMTKPEDPTEMRLDDMALAMVRWLNSEYKMLPEAWKDPKVIFKAFDGDITHVQLWFYVDNIRLEHDGRLQRVRTDIARRIREELDLLAPQSV